MLHGLDNSCIDSRSPYIYRVRGGSGGPVSVADIDTGSICRLIYTRFWVGCISRSPVAILGRWHDANHICGRTSTCRRQAAVVHTRRLFLFPDKNRRGLAHRAAFFDNSGEKITRQRYDIFLLLNHIICIFLLLIIPFAIMPGGGIHDLKRACIVVVGHSGVPLCSSIIF